MNEERGLVGRWVKDGGWMVGRWVKDEGGLVGRWAIERKEDEKKMYENGWLMGE